MVYLLESTIRERLKSEVCWNVYFLQALVTPEKFQHILRVLNTNIDGRTKIMFGLTSIKVRV